MLVFIDESGCTGFKLDCGSSHCFVLAMVIFTDYLQAEAASSQLKQLQHKLRVKPEFKFNKSHRNIKDAFFQTIKPFNFTVRAIVVSKTHIYSPHLQKHTRNFYNFFIAQLMQHDNNVLQNASIKLDGSGERQFMREMKTYLNKQLPHGKIRKLRLVDSKKDYLIQLADMVAGAIARAHHPQRLDDTWLKILKADKKIDNIWFFK